jgi:hypothetical protein
MNTIERLLEIQRLANAVDETPAERCRAIFYIASHAIVDKLALETNALKQILDLRAELETAQAVHANDMAALARRAIEIKAQRDVLLSSVRWFVRQCQGDSGTGDSHWSQFPEYRLAKRAIELADAEQRLVERP